MLIEIFLKNYGNATAKMAHDPLIRSSVHAVNSALQLGEKIIFADSTMQMLIEKLAHPTETIAEIEEAVGSRSYDEILDSAQSFRGAWIEFPKPIEKTAAMLSFIPGHYIPTGKDSLQLYLIGVDGEPVDVLEQINGTWTYNMLLHRCFQCKPAQPCERCTSLLRIWSSIWAFSAIISAQYLAARRYEEKPVTGMRRVPRKNSGKERRYPVKHIFKVIDANEIIIQIPEPDQSEHTKETRGSWINEDTIYEEITTKPFTRTYRHERYVNVKGQTLEFKQGIKRLQPRKVDRLGKTITKVKASLYEKQENE